ncbi:EamA family transporter [Curtobacterium ammoniigenes]|uniref:EamA family transporter n=1 Tax=Curtobacterium ammoniigenes TaxID=395387 RepID=UPI000A84CB91|nr:EamA family transporter [Curtobacterium ammoniigenes]
MPNGSGVAAPPRGSGDLAARVPAPILAFAAIVSVQIGAAIARTHFGVISPTGAATLRLVIGAPILFAVVRPRLRSWGRAQWGAALALGIALGGMNVCIYIAFATVPIGTAVTIEFLGPLVLALAHTRRWRDVGWAVLALVGVVLLGVGTAGRGTLIGVVFALLAAICWAGYIVLNRHVGQRIPGVDGLALSMLVALVVAIPAGGASALAAVVHRPPLLLVFVAVAVLSSVLPYALEMLALRRMPTRAFGVFQSLGPAVAAFAGFAIVGQTISVADVVAMTCVITASLGTTLVADVR